MRRLSLFALMWLLFVPSAAWSQFKDTAPTGGAQLAPGSVQKLKVGVIIKAEGGTCQNVIATVPVPSDWPEQDVKVLLEDLSPTVQNMRYRTSAGQLKQMLVEVPQLPVGQEARALVTFEITRSKLLPPHDTKIYKIPKKLDRRLQIYVGSSPYIESRHPKITALAKQLVADKETAWEQVEALYDWVLKNVSLKEANLKGAARTLNDKNGGAEDLTSLFIALCRASKIPARTVWIPEHCYPEFYLVDDEGEGHWFPCQVAGSRSFGGIDEQRPILLKGDSFKDAERPRERQRFVSEFVKGSGTGRPQVTFVRESVTN